MTWMSRAAGRPWHQLGRRMSAGLERELGTKPGVSFEGARAADCSEEHVPDGIVSGDAITIPATPNLVVTHDVSGATAFWAEERVAVHRNP